MISSDRLFDLWARGGMHEQYKVRLEASVRCPARCQDRIHSGRRSERSEAASCRGRPRRFQRIPRNWQRPRVCQRCRRLHSLSLEIRPWSRYVACLLKVSYSEVVANYSDDIWWYMMIYDDIWWYMMIYDDRDWHFFFIYDDIWWMKNPGIGIFFNSDWRRVWKACRRFRLWKRSKRVWRERPPRPVSSRSSLPQAVCRLPGFHVAHAQLPTVRRSSEVDNSILFSFYKYTLSCTISKKMPVHFAILSRHSVMTL